MILKYTRSDRQLGQREEDGWIGSRQDLGWKEEDGFENIQEEKTSWDMMIDWMGTSQSNAINQNKEHRKMIWFENEGRYVLTALVTQDVRHTSQWKCLPSNWYVSRAYSTYAREREM